jgi:hypothetical protein
MPLAKQGLLSFFADFTGDSSNSSSSSSNSSSSSSSNSSSSSSSSSRDNAASGGASYKYSKKQPQSKYTSPTAAEDLAAWCAGASLQQLVQMQDYKLSEAVVSVLQGLQISAGRAPGGRPFDWQRLLGELGVSNALLAAVKEGMAAHSGDVDKKGRVKMTPVRAFIKAHPVVGAMVAEREAAEGQDSTFAQIQAVRRGVAAGAL